MASAFIRRRRDWGACVHLGTFSPVNPSPPTTIPTKTRSSRIASAPGKTAPRHPHPNRRPRTIHLFQRLHPRPTPSPYSKQAPPKLNPTLQPRLKASPPAGNVFPVPTTYVWNISTGGTGSPPPSTPTAPFQTGPPPPLSSPDSSPPRQPPRHGRGLQQSCSGTPTTPSVLATSRLRRRSRNNDGPSWILDIKRVRIAYHFSRLVEVPGTSTSLVKQKKQNVHNMQCHIPVHQRRSPHPRPRPPQETASPPKTGLANLPSPLKNHQPTTKISGPQPPKRRWFSVTPQMEPTLPANTLARLPPPPTRPLQPPRGLRLHPNMPRS